MRKLIQRLARDLQLWIYRKNEVGQFEGLRLVDLNRPPEKIPHFRDILLSSLSLLKETDRNRFNRVSKYLCWIVRTTLSTRGRAEYHHSTRTCQIDFIPPSAEYDSEWLIGWYACTLIHEATHGKIQSLSIAYTPKLRVRIERLCVKEEQCFLLRLTITKPDLAERLYREFDASKWRESWRATQGERLRAEFRRIFSGK
jgi:hypothetical protein